MCSCASRERLWASVAGDASQLNSVTSALLGKENLAGEATRVVDMALKLQHLLARASRQRAMFACSKGSGAAGDGELWGQLA